MLNLLSIKMRTFIYHIAKLLFYAIFIYLGILIICGEKNSFNVKANLHYCKGSFGHTFSRLSEVKHYNDLDILFLGSSHCYRSFDTRIFKNHGFKTFNLGSSSQTPIQTQALINRYLNKLNPKLVVYEVYPITFEIDGVESSLDIVSNDLNDIHSLEMALKVNDLSVYNTLIYAYIQDVFRSNQDFKEPVEKENDRYISGGFVERELGFSSQQKFEKKELKIRNEQLQAFEEIVNTIKNANIELLLVYAPIPKKNYERFINNDQFDQTMSGLGTYINFNEIMDLNDSISFFDGDHLNQNGVIQFNKELIDMIRSRKMP
jgi:hypothetical protein